MWLHSEAIANTVQGISHTDAAACASMQKHVKEYLKIRAKTNYYGPTHFQEIESFRKVMTFWE